MFKQRLITALILIPVFLGILFFSPKWLMIGLFALMILGCGWEWTKLIPLHTLTHNLIFLALLLVVFSGWMLLPYWVLGGLIVWLLIVVAELTYPRSQAYWGHPLIVAGLGLLLLPLAFWCLSAIYLLDHGKALMLYMFLIVWSADTGAYFAGKLWGKHKCIPLVSPGKSWEGILGGMALALIVAFLGYVYFKPPHALGWFIVAIDMILISIIGDLFISMLKRRVGLKDTGTLLPGHGGILDRLDSLIAVSPLFYFGLIWVL